MSTPTPSIPGVDRGVGDRQGHGVADERRLADPAFLGDRLGDLFYCLEIQFRHLPGKVGKRNGLGPTLGG